MSFDDYRNQLPDFRREHRRQLERHAAIVVWLIGIVISLVVALIFFRPK